MPRGMTPYDFVRRVYYAQEKVLLDLWPTDDKYKEVITEANVVIHEFQRDWDWSFLRQQLILGSTNDPAGPGAIPAYIVPKHVYKVATFPDDCVRLYASGHCHKGTCHSCHSKCFRLDERNYIEVPFSPVARRHKKLTEHLSIGGEHLEYKPLTAVLWGDEIHFSRPPRGPERNRIAVTDVQLFYPDLHICDNTCTDKDGNTPSYTSEDYRPCDKIEHRIFEDIPDPEYFVLRTAALHCVGSPPAAHRAMDLTEQARTFLTAMRDNDQQYTEPDSVERAWDVMTYDHIGGTGFGYGYNYGYDLNYPTRGNGWA